MTKESICPLRDMAWRIANPAQYVESKREGNCACLGSECAWFNDDAGACGHVSQAFYSSWKLAKEER